MHLTPPLSLYIYIYICYMYLRVWPCVALPHAGPCLYEVQIPVRQADGSLARRPPKSKSQHEYYMKLTRLFQASDNHLFHAYAWHKIYSLVRYSTHTLTHSHMGPIKNQVHRTTTGPVGSDTKGPHAEKEGLNVEGGWPSPLMVVCCAVCVCVSQGHDEAQGGGEVGGGVHHTAGCPLHPAL